MLVLCSAVFGIPFLPPRLLVKADSENSTVGAIARRQRDAPAGRRRVRCHRPGHGPQRVHHLWYPVGGRQEGAHSSAACLCILSALRQRNSVARPACGERMEEGRYVRAHWALPQQPGLLRLAGPAASTHSFGSSVFLQSHGCCGRFCTWIATITMVASPRPSISRSSLKSSKPRPTLLSVGHVRAEITYLE